MEESLKISGLTLKEAKIFPDNRGEFSCRPLTGLWIQENISVSKKGVFRGLHLQVGPNAQVKNVRILSGSVLDIIIDLRRDSATFLAVDFITLTGHKKNEINIPAGCGHGFLALEEDTIMQYLVDKPYDPANEVSILPHSVPAIKLALEKALPAFEPIISPKDLAGISLAEFQKSL